MQEVFICLEEICQAISRFDISRKDQSKGGQHQGHDCQNLEDIEANIQTLIQFQSTIMVDTLYSDLDESRVIIQKACTLLIDQYFAHQKTLIQSNLQSNDYTKSRGLVNALHERDLGFLKQNQDLYHIFREPESLIKVQQDDFNLIKKEISENCCSINEKLKEIFRYKISNNKISTEINKNKPNLENMIQDQNSLLINQQNILNMNKDQIQELLKFQDDLVLEIQILEQINQNQELLNDEKPKIQDNLQIIKIQDDQIKLMLEAKMKEDISKQLIPSQQSLPKWSQDKKNAAVSIHGKVADSQNAYVAVLIEPQLSIGNQNKVKLTMTSSGFGCNWIHICDYKQVKSMSPTLETIYKVGFGAYSLQQTGYVFGTDTYGEGKTKGFTFKIGDIIELQWDGSKVFTTVNLTTDQKFVFTCNFSDDAEIYFAVSLYTGSFRLI